MHSTLIGTFYFRLYYLNNIYYIRKIKLVSLITDVLIIALNKRSVGDWAIFSDKLKYSGETLILNFWLGPKNENSQAFLRFTWFMVVRQTFALPSWTMRISRKPANFRFLELAGSSELTSPHCTCICCTHKRFFRIYKNNKKYAANALAKGFLSNNYSPPKK